MAARELFAELAAELVRRPEVSLGRALQNEVLKVDDKIFAFVREDHLVVKLPATQATGLVDAGDAAPFESGGRVMKEWVAVPPAPRECWRQLLGDALSYVGGE